ELAGPRPAPVAETGNGAPAEPRLAMVQLHLATHLVPFRLRDPLGNAAIRHYLHHAIRHQHVDEHAVVVGRIPYAQLPEQLHGPLPGRQIVPQLHNVESRLHDEPDLAGVPRFGFAHSRFDGLANPRREMTACAPTQSEQVTRQAHELHESLYHRPEAPPPPNPPPPPLKPPPPP